mgnify:CR=1 FL=1
MIPGPTLLVACPHCATVAKQPTWASISTALWPLLASALAARLCRCASCAMLFSPEDAEVQGTVAAFGGPREEVSLRIDDLGPQRLAVMALLRRVLDLELADVRQLLASQPLVLEAELVERHDLERELLELGVGVQRLVEVIPGEAPDHDLTSEELEQLDELASASADDLREALATDLPCSAEQRQWLLQRVQAADIRRSAADAADHVRTRFMDDGQRLIEQATALQQAYWTANPEERAALTERFPAELSWPERLRLHHLLCLELVGDRALDDETLLDSVDKEDNETLALVEQTYALLVSNESPYLGRVAMVFQGVGEVEEDEQPSLAGCLFNPSLTHLGSLEIIRVNDDLEPEAIDFVPFDVLHAVSFPTPPAIYRAAQLFYEDKQSELCFVPLLYGISHRSPLDSDKDGSQTRFACHVGCELSPAQRCLSFQNISDGGAALGLGIGQQDLSVSDGESSSLFGLASLKLVDFPLDIADPSFDDRCRRRGLDPEALRRDHGPQ